MNGVEQAMFSDVVYLVNRTENKLEFRWDSVIYELKGGERKIMPRHVAMKGISVHHTKLDPTTLLPSESLFGIDEEGTEFPIDALGEVDLEAIAETPKGESDETSIDGETIKKKLVDIAATSRSALKRK